MEIAGRITQVLTFRNGVSQRTGNAWASQQYVIEEDGVQYPQSLLFEVFGQDKIQQYHLAVGQMVKVSFSMRTRTYNGKVYNDTPRAYNVVPLQPQQPQAYQPQQQYQQQQYQQPAQQQYRPQAAPQQVYQPQQPQAPQPPQQPSALPF